MSNVFFPVQPQPGDGNNVNVLRRRRIVLPWFYALIASYDEDVAAPEDAVRVNIELNCVRKTWFDNLQGPPFPPMNGLALQGSMRNFTLSISLRKLRTINGVIAPEVDVDMDEHAHSQPAHFHEGNWVEVLFAQGRVGVPVVLRLARQADPAFLDLDYDEHLVYLKMMQRVRPPRSLIRLKQFVAGM